MPPVAAVCLRKPRHAGSKAIVAGQRLAPRTPSGKRGAGRIRIEGRIILICESTHEKERRMNRLLLHVALFAAFIAVTIHAPGQNPPPAQAPKANADPYANNPGAGNIKFPLAAL